MRNNKGMRDPLYTSRKNGRGLHVKYSLQPYLKFKSDIFRTHLTPRVSEIRVWNKSAKKAAPITLHLVVCHSAACKMVRKFIVMHRLRIQDRGRGLRFDIRTNGEYSRKYRDMEIESFESKARTRNLTNTEISIAKHARHLVYSIERLREKFDLRDN